MGGFGAGTHLEAFHFRINLAQVDKKSNPSYHDAILSVLQSVLAQDCATNCGHDQEPSYDSNEHLSTGSHFQFANGLPTPPESVRAPHLEGFTAVKLPIVEGCQGNHDLKESTMASQEALSQSDQDELPIILSWIPTKDQMSKCSDFERSRKKTWRKTVSSGLKEPKSNRGVTHDGLLTAGMLQIIDRIGEARVLEGLRDTITELNVGSQKDWQSFDERCSERIPKHLTDQPDSIRQLWLLKEKLDLTEANEQISRLRKRLTLADFSQAYDLCASQYLNMKSGIRRPRSRPGQQDSKTPAGGEARNSQHKRAAMDHFVDLLFPNALPSGKTSKAARRRGAVTRYAAVRKIQNWRAAGQPWANIFKRFGKGILLLIPDEVSDEYMRTMSKAALSAFLDRVELRLAGRADFLHTLTSLVDTFYTSHALPHGTLSKGCLPGMLYNARTSPQVRRTDSDSPSAFLDTGTTSWSYFDQSNNVDQHQCAESGFVFDLPVDADKMDLYVGESSSQFALAPHETFREAPYTTFLSHLAGETDLSADLCSAFVSGDDDFQLPPNEGASILDVDVDAFLAKSPTVPSLTADTPRAHPPCRVSRSANSSFCEYHDSDALYVGMDSPNANCKDVFDFLNLSEDGD
ncbi:uncharacterized protein PV06_11028 [Exophiala oligosperma]|uniref:Uncharacterized protein n=1 Tax=Exophiala oligosperma TaxID=215243 RepID=A0A0D2BGW2_9EURO|nr:uncharacterized protein PV06_11028 [Exophiala oligosperma]KIW36732.1 hypothetical protein PV06_11028 [Exophiala oligosperma]